MQPVCIKIGSWVCFITLNLILLPVITTAHETEACCSQWAGCVSDYILPCISSGIHLTVVGAALPDIPRACIYIYKGVGIVLSVQCLCARHIFSISAYMRSPPQSDTLSFYWSPPLPPYERQHACRFSVMKG